MCNVYSLMSKPDESKQDKRDGNKSMCSTDLWSTVYHQQKSSCPFRSLKASQKSEGVIKRGEKGLWDSLIFRIALILQPFLVVRFPFWETLRKNVKQPSLHMRSLLSRRCLSLMLTHIFLALCAQAIISLILLFCLLIS